MRVVGTAVTPAVPEAEAPEVAGVAGVAGPVEAPAGANPLNWDRVTPEEPARALNWLSKLDSSASRSVGLWTEGICVLIFCRSAQLLESFWPSDRRVASLASSWVCWPCS